MISLSLNNMQIGFNLIQSAFFVLFISTLICFILSIILHNKRLSKILNTKDPEKLADSKITQQPFLAAASLSSILSLMFLSYVILLSNTQPNTFQLYADFISVVFIVVMFLSFPLLISNDQASLAMLLEFFIGIVIGFSFSILITPISWFFDPLSIEPSPSIGYGARWAHLLNFFYMILIFVIIILGLISKNYLVLPGVLFGTFSFYSYTRYMCIISVDFAIFGLFTVFAIGVIVALLHKWNNTMFVWFIPVLFSVIRIFSNVALAFSILLGIALCLVSILEPEKKIKIKLLTAFLIGFIVIAILEHPLITYSLIIVILISLSSFYIAEMYKKAIRAIIKKWIVSIQSSNGKMRVYLTKHKSFQNISDAKFDKNSFFLFYLDNLILKHLKKEGFKVDIIEGEDKKGKKYIENIVIER